MPTGKIKSSPHKLSQSILTQTNQWSFKEHKVTQMWKYPNTDDPAYGGSKTAHFTELKNTCHISFSKVKRSRDDMHIIKPNEIFKACLYEVDKLSFHR